MTQLQWGILGTGNIAKKFADAVVASETGSLVAVGSRVKETADVFGQKYGLPRSYATYDELVNDPEVQAIYISLPNHLHAEWIKKCAYAGKHILCEKPLTVNYAEAEDALKVVDECGVFHMEAFMYRCHPQTRKIAELLNAGAIGEVRLIQSSFSYNLGPKYENIRLSNPAAGGGIMDVGCYTISLARLAAGREPDNVQGTAVIGPVSRVDEVASGSFRFLPRTEEEIGCIASLSCGTQVALPRDAYLWGSEGSIRIPNPWFPSDGDNVIYLNRNGKEPEEIHIPGNGVGLYTYEADLVAQCIAQGRKEAPAPAMTWADSLGNMRALDAWRKAVGLSFDAEA
jgi:predicted dehydrogenase